MTDPHDKQTLDMFEQVHRLQEIQLNILAMILVLMGNELRNRENEVNKNGN